MIIDTHAHLDGEEFNEDLPQVIERAKLAGIEKIFLPAIDLPSIDRIMQLCDTYPHYCFPMIGLQPEEVKADYKDVLAKMYALLKASLAEPADSPRRVIAIGEVGLDFYWSREFEKEQMEAYEEALLWSVETRLPLMIHCRKAQNEMLHLMARYEKDLPGGVFHCFTGNTKEAEAFLKLDKFVLGIGGVSTFKSSHLREDLPKAVPLDRIVLETDSPYMSPVPYRGKRNESAYITEVLDTLAGSYGIDREELARITNENVKRVFHV